MSGLACAGHGSGVCASPAPAQLHTLASLCSLSLCLWVMGAVWLHLLDGDEGERRSWSYVYGEEETGTLFLVLAC